MKGTRLGWHATNMSCTCRARKETFDLSSPGKSGWMQMINQCRLETERSEVSQAYSEMFSMWIGDKL